MSTTMSLPSHPPTSAQQAHAVNPSKSFNAHTVNPSKSFSSPPRSSSLECDYDVNPTFLYQAIEAKQWDHAVKVFSKPDAQRQCATWVTRKEGNGKLRWRLLPIHAAIIFQTPLEIVELLLQEFPSGALQKDDQGMLPLHLAFRNDAGWEVLEELMTAHPHAVNVKDRKGRTPIECASSRYAKRASVMALYTQITVAQERQRAISESRAMVETRVSALQGTHMNSLQALKQERDDEHSRLVRELDETQKALERQSFRFEETSTLLAQKAATEIELTQKLQLVTDALQNVNQARTIEASAERALNSKHTKVLEDSNKELLMLVQTMLDQQTALKVQLDKQGWQSQENVEKKTALLQELTALETEEGAAAQKERDYWRTKLEESNEQIATKLDAMRKREKISSPRKLPLAK